MGPRVSVSGFRIEGLASGVSVLGFRF